MSSKKHRFVNTKVQQEVESDFTLFAIWCSTRSTFDIDIDPLFNPDWMRSMQTEEAEHLLMLKIRLLALREELDERKGITDDKEEEEDK